MQKDEVLRCYLSDNARYADLMNGMIFEGRNVVQPEDLRPLDSRVEGENSTRYHDLIRRSCFGVNFAVVGVENQEEVHYLMPLRCAEYDVLEYRRQAKEIRQRIGQNDPVPLTSAEYLSKFRRSDRLHPCVTLVLFYGEDWDGSRELYGLMDFTDLPPEFRSLVNNYHMNLLEVRKLSGTDMFHTDLKQVLDFIRCSKDKKKLRELVEQEEAYRHMDKEAYDVAMTFTHSKELKAYRDKAENQEDLDMCQAITEMLADEREEGRSEGIELGRSQGIELGRSQGRSEGIELGRNEGRLEGMLHTLYNLVEQGLLTLRDAAVQAQMPESEFLAGMQKRRV